jgi:hypothetical protein
MTSWVGLSLVLLLVLLLVALLEKRLSYGRVEWIHFISGGSQGLSARLGKLRTVSGQNEVFVKTIEAYAGERKVKALFF